MNNRWLFAIVTFALIVMPCALMSATFFSLNSMPVLASVTIETYKPQLLDRNGRPLTVTYQNRWNQHDQIGLYEVPPLLQQAFVLSEDQRFFEHKGIDWRARWHALWQNLIALDTVRGASTISEQVVRMIHPRERTLWSRWLEGFEAQRLEKLNGKAEILEFYLNQVPYAAQRRGVVQAANYYFNRDLSTLTQREMLALVVMVRAPGRFNLHNDVKPVEQRTALLAKRALEQGILDEHRYPNVLQHTLRGVRGDLQVQARHFAHYVYELAPENASYIETTLDASIQGFAQRLLDQRLEYLEDKNIDNAGLLVVDHETNDILAWVVGGSSSQDELLRSNVNNSGIAYDAVRSPRQPGSALKPFVYASAIAKGWTAATMIDDSPLSEAVGRGLHTYRNYSRTYYGNISLRNALGNSLNIPAIKAMQFVGTENLLHTFHSLGIRSLDQHPNYYGDGLALGNGEVTLYELVQSYATLARGGVFKPLRAMRLESVGQVEYRVFDEQVATLIGNILSDADARALEFGSSGLLDFPVQTALKTGTSSDYRDAWAVGYNYRYTAGVWMGNLRGNGMREITGSTGPALILRSVFAELTRHEQTKRIPLSPLLVKQAVCVDSGLPANDDCQSRSEWFVSGAAKVLPEEPSLVLRIRQPYSGLEMALDPRIPDDREAFEFQLNEQEGIQKVQWYLNGELLAQSRGPNYLWRVTEGRHRLQATVWRRDSYDGFDTPAVEFVVK